MMIWELPLLILLVALSAFFSGAEIALFSLSSIKVKKLIRMRKRGAGMVRKLKSDPHRMLATILVGNNVVNVAAAAIATAVATEAFGSSGLGIATGIMTLVLLVFGEVIPKSFCHQNAEKMALMVAHPLYLMSVILYPVIFVVENMGKGVLRLMGVKKRTKEDITEDELMAAISLGIDAGVIDKNEEEMMQNVIEFGEERVKTVMTPFRSMVYIEPGKELSDVLAKMLETKYSRMPVYDKAKRKVEGIINLRSILNYIKLRNFSVPVRYLIEPAIYVKENDSLEYAFEKLKINSAHMAVVTDGHKSVKGIVTMEDLLEEIVGEIYDESDRKRYDMRRIDRKTAVVNGEMAVKDIQRRIGIPLKGGFQTISELMSARFEGQPRKGDNLKLKNFILTVVLVDKDDPSKIKNIKIYKRRGKILHK
ncbi:MAG: hemolysin family protein [Candidatus Aenigmatarchaeota archaeon]